MRTGVNIRPKQRVPLFTIPALMFILFGSGCSMIGIGNSDPLAEKYDVYPEATNTSYPPAANFPQASGEVMPASAQMPIHAGMNQAPLQNQNMMAQAGMNTGMLNPTMPQNYHQNNQAQMPQASAPQGRPPLVLVEFVPQSGATQYKKLPIHSARSLQNAIVASDAVGKFKRFDIAVSRLPQYPGGTPQKLISDYDHVSKQIPMGYDYALQPGDRVVIVEDKSSVMDDVLGGAINPVRSLIGYEKETRTFK